MVVCCATVESARLLLNSVSPQHPAGLGNSSGVVGHYLHGHVATGARIYLKELEGTKPINQDGATDHVYIPRFDYRDPHRGYAGGFGIQVNYDSYMFPRQAMLVKGYGAEFKRRVRTMQPGYLMLGGFGKSTAAQTELRFRGQEPRGRAWHSHSGDPLSVRGERHAGSGRGCERALQQIASELSAECLLDQSAGPSGFASHEVGTIRMGKDPKTSALNRLLPVARSEEPLCDRWQLLHHVEREESDADHHGVVHARGGVHHSAAPVGDNLGAVDGRLQTVDRTR